MIQNKILEYRTEALQGDIPAVENKETENGIKDSSKVCSILKYNGVSESFAIPDYIEECPVVTVDKYAFSEHRELQCLHLGRYIREMGSHCFYNCRSLREITLYDEVVSIGDGAFKNCDKIKKINLTSSNGSMRSLKGLLSELNQELTVQITFPDGIAVLVFPYFFHDYEENTPARIINQITVGSGVHYRECVTAEGIDYTAYDYNFDAEKYLDVMESAWKVALYRLMHPYNLSIQAEALYREYLQDNKWNITEKLIDENLQSDISGCLSIGMLGDSECRKVAEYARSREQMEILSIILQYRNDTYGNGNGNQNENGNETGYKIYEF